MITKTAKGLKEQEYCTHKQVTNEKNKIRKNKIESYTLNRKRRERIAKYGWCSLGLQTFFFTSHCVCESVSVNIMHKYILCAHWIVLCSMRNSQLYSQSTICILIIRFDKVICCDSYYSAVLCSMHLVYTLMIWCQWHCKAIANTHR